MNKYIVTYISLTPYLDGNTVKIDVDSTKMLELPLNDSEVEEIRKAIKKDGYCANSTKEFEVGFESQQIITSIRKKVG